MAEFGLTGLSNEVGHFKSFFSRVLALCSGRLRFSAFTLCPVPRRSIAAVLPTNHRFGHRRTMMTYAIPLEKRGG